MTKEKYDCSWCHAFSRPERNLEKPPTDEVAITRVVYDAGADTLTVHATSSDQGTTGAVALAAEGYGKLVWRAAPYNYYRRVYTLGADPGSVTVKSSGGGSATVNTVVVP